MKNYKQLLVWQKSMEAFAIANAVVKDLPKEERFECGSQLRRAALSIPSNIAEGSAYTGKAMYKKYLEIALGSSYEVETILLALIKIYNLENNVQIIKLSFLNQEVQKMLFSFITKLKSDALAAKS